LNRNIGLDLEGWELSKALKLQWVIESMDLLSPEVRIHLFSNKDAVVNALEHIPYWLRHRIFPWVNSSDKSLASMIEQLKKWNIDIWLSSEDTGEIWRGAVKLWRINRVIPSLCVKSFNTWNDYGESLFLDAGFDIWKWKTIQQRASKMIEDVIMSSLYVQALKWISKARVWLLTNWIEESKWDDLVSKVRSMLEELDFIDFIWYVEWDSATNWEFDILLTDGHTWNIALKLVEWQLYQMWWEISEMIKKNGIKGIIAWLLLRKDLERMKDKRNPDKYPLAIFLGYLKLLWKIHGWAKQEWYTNGLVQADEYIKVEQEHGLIDLTKERLNVFRESLE